jgi:N-acetylmuramoyl-L-alanine amidase
MALVVSVVIEDDINLRQDPDNTSPIVGQLAPGVFVPVHEISEDGLWLKVGLDTIGWVNASLVTLSGSVEVAEFGSSERQPLLQADSPVNVRSGPGIKFRVIGRLKAGQIIDVLETSEDANWVKIPFGNGEGWVNTGTVIVSGGKPTTTPIVTEVVTREP